MNRYRILTNGAKYRVQRRFRFGPINYWRNEYFFVINDSYPKVVKEVLEFENIKDAESFIATCMAAEGSSTGDWWVVKKYSDAPEHAETVHTRS